MTRGTVGIARKAVDRSNSSENLAHDSKMSNITNCAACAGTALAVRNFGIGPLPMK